MKNEKKKAWCYKCNKSTDFTLWKPDIKLNAAMAGGANHYYICPVCQTTLTPKIEE